MFLYLHTLHYQACLPEGSLPLSQNFLLRNPKIAGYVRSNGERISVKFLIMMRQEVFIVKVWGEFKFGSCWPRTTVVVCEVQIERQSSVLFSERQRFCGADDPCTYWSNSVRSTAGRRSHWRPPRVAECNIPVRICGWLQMYTGFVCGSVEWFGRDRGGSGPKLFLKILAWKKWKQVQKLSPGTWTRYLLHARQKRY